MTKARTRAQRRKRGKISLAGGEVAEIAVLVTRPPAEDPREAAVKARLRMADMRDNRDNRAKVLAPVYTCAVGRAIEAHQDAAETRTALHSAVRHIRKTVIAADRAVGAPNRHAQCLRILSPADVMHADAESPPLDTRTELERYHQSIAALQRLETWLAYSSNAARALCRIHVVDEPDAPIHDFAAVRSALLCVAEGLAGKTPVYRG